MGLATCLVSTKCGLVMYSVKEEEVNVKIISGSFQILQLSSAVNADPSQYELGNTVDMRIIFYVVSELLD